MADPRYGAPTYDPSRPDPVLGAGGGGGSTFLALLRQMLQAGKPLTQIDSEGRPIPGTVLPARGNTPATAAQTGAPYIRSRPPGLGMLGDDPAINYVSQPSGSPGSPRDPQDIFAAALQAFMDNQRGSGSAGRSQFDQDTDRMNAESQNAIRQAQIADYMVTQSQKEYELALKSGDLALAKQKLADSQVWSKRAADANDRANSLSAAGHMISGYGREDAALLGRGELQSRGATNMTALTGILSTLAQAQGELGLKIASTPKNAIAGMMLSRGAPMGQAMAGGQSYAPGNSLGFDPGQLQSMIQQAMAAAQQQMQAPPMPSFDMNQVISGLRGAANYAQTTMPPAMVPGPPNDGSGDRVVGNRVPDNGYQSVYDRMKNGGAPQATLDRFRETAAGIGFPGAPK